MTDPQSYANHVRRPHAWSAAFVLALSAFVLLLSLAIEAPSWQGLGLAVLALSVLLTVSVLRMYVIRLQDRIVRLEMQIRLTSLGCGAELRRLSLRQLVALRFASDRELPALVDRAITENLTADAIKRAVTDWQSDLIRV
jgi:hypothetical protein